MVTGRFVEQLASVGSVTPIDLAPPQNSFRVWQHIARAKATGGAVVQLLTARRARGTVLYLAVDGGLGGIYDLLLAVVARVNRHRIVMHHHSFAYLNKRTSVMRMLTWVGGRETMHVVLCELMGNRLKAQYVAVEQSIVLSNAWCVSPTPYELHSGKVSEPIRLGHLSNLCHTKGLLDVIEVYHRARRRSIPVSLLLAGPIMCEEAQRAISALEGDVDARWLGPVGEAEKEKFHRSIDVFLFPSRYRNEAEPLVLWEALAAGNPILVVDRGCIRAFGVTAGALVTTQEDYVSEAVNAIERLALDDGRLREAQRGAVEAATAAHDVAMDVLRGLVSAIFGGVGS